MCFDAQRKIRGAHNISEAKSTEHSGCSDFRRTDPNGAIAARHPGQAKAINIMERNVNRKKYFPSDAEEEFDLRDDIPNTADDLHRRHDNDREPRAAAKDGHFRHDRSKAHEADDKYQSDQTTSSQTRFRARER